MRFLKALLKTLAWMGLTVVILVAGLVAVERFNAREEVPYTWDASVENTSSEVSNLFARDGKHRGVSLVGVRSVELEPLVRTNIEWIAVMPFGWQVDFNTPDITTDPVSGEAWGPRDEEIERLVLSAKQRGLRVFLKPHLWLTHASNGAWRADITMDTEAAWHAWFGEYRAFMLHYARFAERLGIEMLCIGTELHQAAVHREADWRDLIAAIRQIYRGHLTYAANWDDEFEKVAFWDALDYIGVQAYFPLRDEHVPSVDALKEAWTPHMDGLASVSQRFEKPVLFTEIGYRSTETSTAAPWDWGGLFGWIRPVSVQTQVHAYQALFETFWAKEWFAGAFIWQWHGQHSDVGALQARDFTPQHKATQNVLATWYSVQHLVE